MLRCSKIDYLLEKYLEGVDSEMPKNNEKSSSWKKAELNFMADLKLDLHCCTSRIANISGFDWKI